MAEKISIIGAGNVGFHLAQRLYTCGHKICQIYSRTQKKATDLAQRCNAHAINNLNQLSSEAEIYIIAIKDDGVKTLAEEIKLLNKYNKIIAHTSGSVPSTVFEKHFDNYGIFYPLQTFSIQKNIDFEKLPFCIYGNKPEIQSRLITLAKSICPNVYPIDDYQRSILHVTAVIVNNFSNYLFSMADQICNDQNVPFDILKPLINETVQKIMQLPPKDVQTGPAARGDNNTINKHMDFLEQYPDYQFIYKTMSEQILAQQKKTEEKKS